MASLLPSLAIFGISETLLILAVAVLFFGAGRLPKIAKGLGHGIRNFKGELKAPPDDRRDDD
ncbi:MAG: twin-arginine translocase TatA/TatE family subunit [Gemmatimonadetes bacterium]|nr:twin-arginine translocase TatA/TatE family subunit [Gemmatimonadota bacterium]